jgi:Protein of unknown function (DUF3301)
VITIAEAIALLVLGAGGWFLWDSLKVREAANTAMRAACKTEGLLFLDDTVALQSLWPARNDLGRITLRRVYGFEYSDTGHNRRKGSITMVADAVSALDVGLNASVDATLH